MNDILINKRDIGAFCNNLKETFTVYGVKQKEEGFYVFDEIDEFSDPLKDYKPTILPPWKIGTATIFILTLIRENKIKWSLSLFSLLEKQNA